MELAGFAYSASGPLSQPLLPHSIHQLVHKKEAINTWGLSHFRPGKDFTQILSLPSSILSPETLILVLFWPFELVLAPPVDLCVPYNTLPWQPFLLLGAAPDFSHLANTLAGLVSSFPLRWVFRHGVSQVESIRGIGRKGKFLCNF